MRRKFKVHGSRHRNVTRLAALAAGAGAVAGVSPDADAAIINTAFDTGNVLNPTDANPLTFNITNLVNPNLGDKELPDFELKFVNNPTNGTNNIQFNSLNNLANAINNPLNAGNNIGPGNAFNEQFDLLTINPNNNNAGGPGFSGLTNAYLGLQVDVPGGSPHYAWLQFDIDPDATLTVRALAIEDRRDVPIVAGQTSSVPEPDSMALFALGAAGIAAWRRRRIAATG